MDTMLRRLRTDAQQLTRGKAPTGVRYPAAFRTRAVALARPRLATGVPFVRVARELGLPRKSLARWLQRRPTPRLRPVAVRPDPAPPAASVVLVTPHGCRVDGLDREGLVAVLRALG
jgi:transposase-like protein